MNNYIELILDYISKILASPTVYKINNLKELLFILILVSSSIINNTNLINYIDNKLILKFIFVLNIIYLIFLIFNFIIRNFNIIRITKYFIINNINNKIRLTYYLYNIFCFIITLFLINRIMNNLFDNNIYIILNNLIFISFILSIMYIDYLTGDNIIINNNSTNKIFKFIIIIYSVIFSYFLVNLVSSLLEEFIIKNNLLNKFISNIFPQNNSLNVIEHNEIKN